MNTNQEDEIRVYSCALVVIVSYRCYPWNPWMKNWKRAA